MNFLLHHRLASRDLGSPGAALGAMLPDLWRMADRRVRPSSAAGAVDADAASATGDLADLMAGIAHHTQADRWFHADSVFVDGERRTGDGLRAAGFHAPKMGLFAHILWELCLDGALVRAAGFERVFVDVRSSVKLACGEASRRAADAHHFARAGRPAAERAQFEGRMRWIADELARGPWIEGYQTGEGIALRLDRVRSRVGFALLDDDDHGRLAEVAAALLDAAAGPVDALLARPGSR